MITNIGRTSKSSSLVAERSASSAFRDAGAKCLFRAQSQTLNRVAGGDSSASQRDRQLQCDTPPFDFGSGRHPLQPACDQRHFCWAALHQDGQKLIFLPAPRKSVGRKLFSSVCPTTRKTDARAPGPS